MKNLIDIIKDAGETVIKDDKHLSIAIVVGLLLISMKYSRSLFTLLLNFASGLVGILLVITSITVIHGMIYELRKNK